MAKEQPLWHRLYTVPVLTAVAKLVGYVGFPVRELAQKTSALRKEFKGYELAAAFQELLTFAGNRVMLNEHARDLCWQLLGPPPEKWESWVRCWMAA